MAVLRAGKPIARPRASVALVGRGKPRMARATVLVDAVAEGVAFADEVEASATRMQTLAAMGDRIRLAHEAGRLGEKATTARIEFRRLASSIDCE